MLRPVLESWFLLLYFDSVMRLRRFQHLHRVVREQTVRSPNSSPGTLCHTMDLACVFYFKQVLCLQRSAATTVMLRRHGWPAEMVIGAQMVPFQSHAWVEIEKHVVNDKPYVTEMFQELERC
jgi:hypothetical protein